MHTEAALSRSKPSLHPRCQAASKQSEGYRRRLPEGPQGPRASSPAKQARRGTPAGNSQGEVPKGLSGQEGVPRSSPSPYQHEG